MNKLKQDFMENYIHWKIETEHLSGKNHSYITKHPAYQKIIEMGEEIIPFILETIKEDGSKLLWHIALEKITGENHAEVDANTDEEKNADWLRWGKTKGLID